jgi:hypothetical protein
MATYFTKTEARQAAKAAKSGSLGKSFSWTLESLAASTKDDDRFDIFLSHSVRDAELIAGVKEILQNVGFSVYVDWIEDRQLDRSGVNKKTAELLRRRMRQSESLVYVATENASESKWMPWELGFFDGFKPGHVAVMPFLDSASATFRSQEYLSLYPIVRKDTYSKSTREDIFVEDIGNQWTTLRRFGSGNPVWEEYNRN